MSAEAARDGPQRVTAGRVIAFYLALGGLTAVVVVAALLAGQGLRPEAPIAGGYDVSAGRDCLGGQVDVKQSGRFVNVENAEDALSGELRVDAGRVEGQVRCVDGRVQDLRARASNGELEGRLGGRPVTATLRRDPPAAGDPRPRTPSSVTGGYRVSPSSSCLGGAFELEDGAEGLELRADGRPLGRVDYAGGVVRGGGLVPAERCGDALRQGRRPPAQPHRHARGPDQRLTLVVQLSRYRRGNCCGARVRAHTGRTLKGARG